MLKKNNGTLHKTKYVIDEATGEVEYLTKDEVSWLENNRTSASVINDKGKLKDNSNLFKMFLDEYYGGFYFNFYNELLDKKYLFRFIFICTYMNYKNYLEFGNAKGINKLVVKKDLQEILGLSRAETYNTINYFLENGFIIEDENRYLIVNNEYCNRGKTDIKKLKKGSVKMFDNAIREIYSKAKPIEHKKLDLLIKLLPYINFKYNVICFNPEEEDSNLIQGINLTELSNIMGYSAPQKLKRALFNIKVNGEKVIMVATFDDNKLIVVNPRVYYKGNTLESIEGIKALFDIANNKK